MLTIDNVTKHFGEIVALDRVSLSLARGEFFGLLGPNGAGKTTLMSLVAGLRAPDSGSISINGQRVGPNAMGPRHELGFVPQAIALYEELSAEENLRLFGKLYGLAGQELRAGVDHGLHAAQLFERRQDKVQTYSGGIKRRINVVASILHRPALLLCDEPTVGVDPQSRNAIFEFLQRLNADGMTIVYSTHYMEEATRLCSRIAIIDHGRMLALGTLDGAADAPAVHRVGSHRAQRPHHRANASTRRVRVRSRTQKTRIDLNCAMACVFPNFSPLPKSSAALSLLQHSPADAGRFVSSSDRQEPSRQLNDAHRSGFGWQ